jgi:alcohol dehydrogenase
VTLAYTLGRLPRIELGPGRVGLIPRIVAGHGQRVLLVTGTRSFRASRHHAKLVQGLRDEGVEVVGEVGIGGEPSPEEVDEAVGRFRGADVQVVLGVGGGSALDAAKAIAGLLRTRTSVLDHLEGVGPMLPYPGPAVPFVAVPTTAGTGSEATRNAVLTRRAPNPFKRSFRDERLVAADAVIDPDLLQGLGSDQIAANGMDAVTQLIEPFVSTRAGPVTDALALSGLEAARDGLPAWHADPDGPSAPGARAAMAHASLLSGICLANAGLGAVHGLASPVGALFPIHHGAACGALLAATVAMNIQALRERDPGGQALGRYARLGRLLAPRDAGRRDDEAYESLVTTLRSWTTQLGIRPLGALGVSATDIPAIVADSRGSSMRTNPVELTDAEIASILSASL